ncbi:MAG: macrolide ABC transporter ATP-binding protein [Candidatus Lumbricidophila eiseniae]|uniref:Macrolide ABC transporter ATP-binding protein n=1 Tax=Candidatus Lumbricidiphila eiseniae TaxID=1969409 RepID=A0A2A6FP64_9MICO|nr:MAG: macrolide ABC transporter ATP-binding protein [Candidatus Lumbricidophila eiseniae]
MNNSVVSGHGSAVSDAVLDFDGVAFSYAGTPPTPVLRDVTITIRRGEYVTLVGPSGSGKSTFLNIVGLLDRASAGRYLLAGRDTSGLSDDERTALRGRSIGFVFQAFHLMPHRSAVENVELAMLYNGTDPSERRARARDTLRRVGLGHRLNSLPTRLSGGERQRVAIARAMVNQPDLLLCDEPTGNLDSTTARAVLELIDELHSLGLTIIVITHDPAVASRGNRQLSILDGILTDHNTTGDHDTTTRVPT